MNPTLICAEQPRARSHRHLIVRLLASTVWLQAANVVAATLTVTNTLDSGAGSLRGQIAAAASGDTITFDPALTFAAPAAITLTGGEISTNKNLTIVGPGADRLTISGNSASRILIFTSGTQNVSLSGLTLANALNTGGFGGGFLSFGSVNVRNCAFTGNQAAVGAAAYVQSGDASFVNCLFTGNTATAQGGAVSFQTTASTHKLDMMNCTLTGNAVTGFGYSTLQIGAFAPGISQVFVRCCTFANNTTTNPSLGEAIVCGSDGAASSSVVTLFGNIFKHASSVTLAIHSQNGGPPGTYISEGYNFASDNGGAFLTGVGDVLNADPLLGPLAPNGGPTQTRALLSGSPAIGIVPPALRPADAFDVDGDSNTAELLPVDQRGITFARVSGGLMDVGAFQTQKPSPVASPALGDIITGNDATDAAGITSIGKYDLLKRGGYFAQNGQLIFPGYLLIGTNGVTLSPNNFMGLWKLDGSGMKLFARSGDTAPETSSTVFDVLPQTPAINRHGEVTFLASLRVGSGAPAATTDDDTGLWSEIGGTGIGILMRESDTIPSIAPLQIGAFGSGAFATAKTSATTGEAAFSITMKNGSTDTAILRASVTGPTVTAVGVVARENTTAPGTAELFGNLAGSYSDPQRMDAAGNLLFAALMKSGRESLWYQPIGGAVTKIFLAGASGVGDVAPGTGGATFKSLKSPAIGSGGTITFRGFLNNDGDNAAGLQNDGIWRGIAGVGFNCILRRGDSALPGMPGGSKVGNVWHSWLTAANHGAWRGWLDLNGDGSSAAPADVQAIYTDLSGTMSMIVKVTDSAPGIAGATFSAFDLPVVGGAEQMAFLGAVTGGGTTPANNKGLWRSAANGGPLALMLRTGDSMVTSQGPKTVTNIDLPGSNTTNRRWEQNVMDTNGRLIVFVTFNDNSTSEVIVP
ncbi:MAG: hypothetical protein K1X78_03525 [Verrucomicrobiaceae bacterium]|nr:hypothetical protein [Verrucomicrobiaceae bacterium]